jgi:hypothetical protein
VEDHILGFGTSAFQIPGAQRGKDCCRLASRFSKLQKTKKNLEAKGGPKAVNPIWTFGHFGDRYFRVHHFRNPEDKETGLLVLKLPKS